LTGVRRARTRRRTQRCCRGRSLPGAVAVSKAGLKGGPGRSDPATAGGRMAERTGGDRIRLAITIGWNPEPIGCPGVPSHAAASAGRRQEPEQGIEPAIEIRWRGLLGQRRGQRSPLAVPPPAQRSQEPGDRMDECGHGGAPLQHGATADGLPAHRRQRIISQPSHERKSGGPRHAALPGTSLLRAGPIRRGSAGELIRAAATRPDLPQTVTTPYGDKTQQCNRPATGGRGVTAPRAAPGGRARPGGGTAPDSPPPCVPR
jgi:hypothetical protein